MLPTTTTKQFIQRDLLIEDKSRQLKPLPDFQKEAEQRRQEAETKELEAIALAKQIEAMKKRDREKVVEVERLAQLETVTVPTLERQLEQERLDKGRAVAEAMTQIATLEQSKREAEEARIKLQESLLLEIARLKEDKDEQSKALQDKFLALTDKLDKPWWKNAWLTRALKYCKIELGIHGSRCSKNLCYTFVSNIEHRSSNGFRNKL